VSYYVLFSIAKNKKEEKTFARKESDEYRKEKSRKILNEDTSLACVLI